MLWPKELICSVKASTPQVYGNLSVKVVSQLSGYCSLESNWTGSGHFIRLLQCRKNWTESWSLRGRWGDPPQTGNSKLILSLSVSGCLSVMTFSCKLNRLSIERH